jgi:hypothetical protein
MSLQRVLRNQYPHQQTPSTWQQSFPLVCRPLAFRMVYHSKLHDGQQLVLPVDTQEERRGQEHAT